LTSGGQLDNSDYFEDNFDAEE